MRDAETHWRGLAGAPVNHNEIDHLFQERGWFYDNGWSHDSIKWDCYINEDYGLTDSFFVILRNADVGRLLRFCGKTKTEIWAGRLSNSEDVDTLMALIESEKS